MRVIPLWPRGVLLQQYDGTWSSKTYSIVAEKTQSRFIRMLQDRFPTDRVLRVVQAFLQLVSPACHAFTACACAKGSFVFLPLVFVARLDRDEYRRIHRDVHRTSRLRDDRKSGLRHLRDKKANSARYLIPKPSYIGCRYQLTSQRRTT